MATNETGHARNIQRLQEMIAFITSWGAPYNPSNHTITLAALNSKLAASIASVDALDVMIPPYKFSVNHRENKYKRLKPLSTRIINFYESCGTEKNNVDDAKSLKRKIDGKRAKAIKNAPNTPVDESLAAVSASQQSYTQLAEHFENLVLLLSGDPTYAPNETELEITELENYRDELKDANLGVIEAVPPVSNARAARNDVMYADTTGLVDIAALVKKYVKAAFGTGSSQYAQIKGLRFRKAIK